jgi:predicted glycoside hydrolase/deacetylase ChbG (UPF0249 family)
MKITRLTLLFLFMLSSVCGSAQTERNLAELLGYPKDSKLLIIHADDMGLAQSVNAACRAAYENKSITSGSIMVPCPWAYEISDYVKDQPGIDVGIHLTLTAEWKLYKWDGVSSSDQIKSLLDNNGFFYPSVEEVGKHANPAEAEKELIAQIDKAVSMGVEPTHLDTHMGSVLASPELVKIYLSLSEKYKLPVLFPRAYVSMLPADVQALFSKKIYLLDNLFMLDESMVKGSWLDAYRAGIQSLKPGLNQVIVHIALNNDEMKAISNEHDDYGAAWRQKDFDLIQSKEFRDLLKSNNVILISWKQIRDLMR